MILAAAVALVVGYVAGRVTAPAPEGAGGVAAPSASGSKTYEEKPLDLDPSPSKGPADAPIVIYEISDFQ